MKMDKLLKSTICNLDYLYAQMKYTGDYSAAETMCILQDKPKEYVFEILKENEIIENYYFTEVAGEKMVVIEEPVRCRSVRLFNLSGSKNWLYTIEGCSLVKFTLERVKSKPVEPYEVLELLTQYGTINSFEIIKLKGCRFVKVKW